MAKGLSYILDENDKRYSSGWFSPGRNLTITYGKCANSPYVENNLWFVTIPAGWRDEEINEYTPKEANFPRKQTTFLVSEQFAREIVIKDFGRDVEKWQKVAQKILIGDWCAKFEKLWQDVQIQEYALLGKDGTSIIVKYGYCRTTSKQRDLWFVSFKDDGDSDDHTYIIDEICATPNFIKHLKTQTRKWEHLCWCYLRHEVKWENLKTGLDAKDLERYQLDSPYSIDEINEKIKFYQDEISNQVNFKVEKPKKKGWFF